MFKKFKPCILAAALLFLLLTFVGCSEAPDYSDVNGETAWSFDEATGELTITGKGNMDDYTVYNSGDLNVASVDDRPWKDHVRSIKRVTLEKGVTSVGNHAFEGCVNLTEVSLPDSLVRIGKHAFFNTCIVSIAIPKGVTRIEDDAFRFSKLERITFHKNSALTFIGEGVFSSCAKLSSIEVPAGVTEIGAVAFGYNHSLTSVTLPTGLTKISSHLFAHCDALESVSIPANVTEIERGAFEDCDRLNAIVIPDKVTAIGERAFDRCPALTEIDLPASLTTIGQYAFEECTALKRVTVAKGSRLETIREQAFYGCTALEEFVLPEDVRPKNVSQDAFWCCPKLDDDFIFRDTSTDEP